MKQGNRTEHSGEYKTALVSPHWRRLRAVVIFQRGKKCGRCSIAGDDSEVNLTMHHKHYQSLGRELPGDVELLCDQCHKKADKERERRTRTATIQRCFDVGLETYASKKYGDDWPEDIEEEFSEWLEGQDY